MGPKLTETKTQRWTVFKTVVNLFKFKFHCNNKFLQKKKRILYQGGSLHCRVFLTDIMSNNLLELLHDFTQFSSYDWQVCDIGWITIGRENINTAIHHQLQLC